MSKINDSRKKQILSIVQMCTFSRFSQFLPFLGLCQAVSGSGSVEFKSYVNRKQVAAASSEAWLIYTYIQNTYTCLNNHAVRLVGLDLRALAAQLGYIAP